MGWGYKLGFLDNDKLTNAQIRSASGVPKRLVCGLKNYHLCSNTLVWNFEKLRRDEGGREKEKDEDKIYSRYHNPHLLREKVRCHEEAATLTL